MYNFKKALAFGMAAVMVVGSSISVFAEAPKTSDTATGAGEAALEGVVNTDVYEATVPTADAVKAIVTYTVDTEGLVKATEAARYSNATVDDSTGVLFQNKDATDNTKTVGLSGVSDPIEFVNKSSDPVDLKLEVKLTSNADSLNMASGSDFTATANSSKDLYLAFASEDAIEHAITSTTDVVANDVVATAEYAYVTAWDSTNTKYTYTRSTDVTEYPTYKVYVLGAANPLSTFTKDSSGTTVAKAMPAITFKYTFTLNANKDGQATWSGSDLWFTDAKESLAKDKAVSGIKINGKDVTISNVKTGEGGWASISWEQIYKAYDSSWTTEDKVPAGFNPTHIEFTVDSKTFIAPIQ